MRPGICVCARVFALTYVCMCVCVCVRVCCVFCKWASVYVEEWFEAF